MTNWNSYTIGYDYETPKNGLDKRHRIYPVHFSEFKKAISGLEVGGASETSHRSNPKIEM